MRTKFRGLVICLLIGLAGINARSQQPLDFRQVDSLTWNYYQAGDWDNVIKTGKSALKNDIDYFYLRARLAHAYFMKQQYRKAIPQYRRALRFNSSDPGAIHGLMYSYEYSGRARDAIRFSNLLRPSFSEDLYQRYSGNITQVTLFGTYTQPFSSGTISDIKDSFRSGMQGSMSGNSNSPFSPQEDGYQKAPRYYFRPLVGLSHKLGTPSLIANHQLGYMLRNEFSVGVEDGDLFPIDYHRVYQFDYRFGLDFTPLSGFTVMPAFHFIYNRIPVYLPAQYGFGNRAPYLLIDNLHEYSYMGSLQIRQEFSLFSVGASGALGQINRVDQQQIGFHFKFYPLYNLNLYYFLNAYYQNQKTELQAAENFIHNHIIGFKATRYLWLEADVILAEFSGFHDTDTSIIYNSPENTGYPVALRGIVPINSQNLRLYFGLGFFNSYSGFVPESDPLKRFNIQKYPNLNITGGLTWNM